MRFKLITLLLLFSTKFMWAQIDNNYLKVGETAPIITGTDQFGSKISSKEILKNNEILLLFYRGNWCPYCKKAMEYFDSKDIRYKVYDIEKDKQAAIRKKVLDKQNGVPFAIVNGQGIHGYVPELYAEALKKK